MRNRVAQEIHVIGTFIPRTLRRAGVLAAILFGLFLAERAEVTGGIDNRLTEIRFSAKSRLPTGNILLVDIDAKSLAEVGVWPWPRSLHGKLVEAAGKLDAAQIAFDVDFSTSSTVQSDAAFAQALAEAVPGTLLAAFVQEGSAGSGELQAAMPIDQLLQNSWPAAVNVPVDGDGRVRSFPYGVEVDGELLASMPAALSGREGGRGLFGIDYAIDPGQLARVSYVDLLRNRVPPEAVAGKTLIVGATALELRDLFPVPAHGIISGSTIIALATETLAQNRELMFVEIPLAALAALALAAILLLGRFPALRLAAALALVAAAVEAGALLLQIRTAVALETGGLHLTLAGLAAVGLAREFDLRRLLLWVARTEVGNRENLIERVIEDGFDGVIILDEQDRVIRINSAATELLGEPQPARLDDLPAPMRNSVRNSRQLVRSGVHPSRNPLQERIPCGGGKDRILEYNVAPFGAQRIAAGERSADEILVCVTLRDVTERQLAHDRMQFMALHDSLTGLHNRRALELRLEQALAPVASGEAMALLSFDLDRFKAVNDALGHATGDKVLLETARRAGGALPAGAFLGRIGGDEFAALVAAETIAAAIDCAETLAASITEPFHIGGHRIQVGASVGVSWWPTPAETPTSVMRQADIALYRAKRSGFGQVVVFEPAMELDRLARLEIERDLGRAFENQEFEVVYQPQLALRTGELVGVEALLRWRHPTRGMVSPVRFIPIAEEMGLIHELSAWVLATACREAAGWSMPIKVAVNVSPMEFETGDVVAAVRKALDGSGIAPERLEIEITESTFVKENERLRNSFDELLELGVKFALDDFGTGYSSLSYLHRYPIAKIKIDRSFVSGLPTDEHAIAILRSVSALAEGLGMRTIAEGIETPEQAEVLRTLGYHDGQGYLFSKPIDANALRQKIEKGLETPHLAAA